jgi:hypothetical protein
MGLDAASIAIYVSVVKDGVVTLAAAVTASIAIYGLRVWKRDLVGKEVYEVMKELVYQSHSISKAAGICMYPLGASEARVFTDEERIHTTANERVFLSESDAYRARLEVYIKSFQDFRDSLLRARVLLGAKVSKAFRSYEAALMSPMALINDYLAVIDDRINAPHPQSEEVIRLRSLFASFDGENEILNSIYEAREVAEKFSLPYLHRKSIR